MGRWRKGQSRHLTWLHQEPTNDAFALRCALSSDPYHPPNVTTAKLPHGSSHSPSSALPDLSVQSLSLSKYSTNHYHTHNHTPLTNHSEMQLKHRSLQTVAISGACLKGLFKMLWAHRCACACACCQRAGWRPGTCCCKVNEGVQAVPSAQWHLS